MNVEGGVPPVGRFVPGPQGVCYLGRRRDDRIRSDPIRVPSPSSRPVMMITQASEGKESEFGITVQVIDTASGYLHSIAFGVTSVVLRVINNTATVISGLFCHSMRKVRD